MRDRHTLHISQIQNTDLSFYLYSWYLLHVAYHITLFLLVIIIYTSTHTIFFPCVSVKNGFIMVGCNEKNSKDADLLVTAKGV